MLNKSSVPWWTFYQPEMLNCKDGGKLEYNNRAEIKKHVLQLVYSCMSCFSTKMLLVEKILSSGGYSTPQWSCSWVRD